MNGALIDADGHVLEPRDMWTRYLDPKPPRRRPLRVGLRLPALHGRAARVIEPLPADSRRRIMGENARRLYRL